MLNRIKKAVRAFFGAEQPTASNYGLDATRVDEGWGYRPWPLDENDAIDEADLRTLWQRAREQYKNSDTIRKAVKTIVNLTGYLTPLPRTKDTEWNALALAAFLARTKNPYTFDLAGRVNYKQGMRHMERRAFIDGDIAIVPTYGSDGGALFQFYPAPQIDGGGEHGVEVDAQGRPRFYYLTDHAGRVIKLPAHLVILYQHEPDPERLRGHSELVAALRNSRDLKTLVGYGKNSAKLSASMGLVGTKAAGVKGPDIGRAVGANSKINARADEKKPTQELGTGLQITHLPEGCDLKQISDSRPSQPLQDFFRYLTRSIANAAGMDPEIVFYPADMNSAAVRFILEKLRGVLDERREDMEVVANRIWRHVISCEIAAGRLRPCRDEAWMNVRWVAQRDLSIDTPRVANAQISLVRENMADNEDFCLRTTGQTPQQLVERRAAEIAFEKEIAEKYGIDPAELHPGQVGSIPAPAAGGKPAPEPLPDDDPEEV